MTALLLAEALSQDFACRKPSDCPNLRDAERGLIAHHGDDTGFLKQKDDLTIERAAPSVWDIYCRKDQEPDSAQCGFVARWKLSFKAGGSCSVPTAGGFSDSGSQFCGQSSRTRNVVYLADFRRTGGKWSIKSADFVVSVK